jgi:uroporphyrinogen decarboxylase
MSDSPRTLSFSPSPDFSRLERVLRREGEPDRVPGYELFSQLVDPVLKRLGQWKDTVDPALSDAEREERRRQNHFQYSLSLGYDYAGVGGRGFSFPLPSRAVGKTNQGDRHYITGAGAMITNRAEFERYPWPDMSKIDYSTLDDAARRMPSGMKGIAGFCGILELPMWLMGYEGISLLLYDDEPLVRDVFDAVASRIVEYLDRCAAHPAVGAIQMGDDMGHRTQTMLSPEVLRKYVFPWHRRLVEAVHAHGKPIILHSCGNLSAVMEDIIDCGWDAKHSFEDAIEPVWEAKARWGRRIALLGGFDMDKITRMTEPQVREHTRFLMRSCAPGGGWAMGTGNSVADYVPVDNFLSMVEEGFCWRA